LPCGFGVSTMVSHNGASNLTSDWRSISAMVFSPQVTFILTFRLSINSRGINAQAQAFVSFVEECPED
jgi:hypothetical protein